MDQSLTLNALSKGLEKGRPEIHHSEGVQYAANEYVQLLRQHDAKISMAEVGQAWQNGYAERLMRTIKEEELTYQSIRILQKPINRLNSF